MKNFHHQIFENLAFNLDSEKCMYLYLLFIYLCTYEGSRCKTNTVQNHKKLIMVLHSSFQAASHDVKEFLLKSSPPV